MTHIGHLQVTVLILSLRRSSVRIFLVPVWDDWAVMNSPFWIEYSDPITGKWCRIMCGPS